MQTSSTRNHPPPEAAVFCQPDQPVTFVSISPFEEDHAFLRNVFDSRPWRIYSARRGKEGIALARKNCASVVVCEEHLPDCAWQDILTALTRLPDAPLLIVTSRLADDTLWAEVLNLGGYDLLMKPLDRLEVLRVIHLAWRQWRSDRQRALGAAEHGDMRRATA